MSSPYYIKKTHLNYPIYKGLKKIKWLRSNNLFKNIARLTPKLSFSIEIKRKVMIRIINMKNWVHYGLIKRELMIISWNNTKIVRKDFLEVRFSQKTKVLLG